jgi:tetratricopeptide (TPR) repeat protein
LLELGQQERGKQELREALRLDSADSVAGCRLADALLQEGRAGEAVPFHEQALGHEPDLLPALRNGAEAVSLATRACEVTGYRDRRALDHLAAAAAESGQFAEAVRAAEQALTLARRTIGSVDTLLKIEYGRPESLDSQLIARDQSRRERPQGFGIDRSDMPGRQQESAGLGLCCEAACADSGRCRTAFRRRLTIRLRVLIQLQAPPAVVDQSSARLRLNRCAFA